MEALRLPVEDHDFADDTEEKTIDVSVVIPVCGGIGDVCEICEQFAREIANSGQSCEFILVIDGSKRNRIGSQAQLKALGPEVRVISVNHSFGESAALSFGFERARAPLIVTLPAYFQVEPESIRQAISALTKNDLDLVISRRYPLPDRLFSRLRSRAFHHLVRLLSGSTYGDLACGFRAMKRRVAEEVTLYGDLHYFFPILAVQRGFNVAEIAVQPSRRDDGRRSFQPASYLRRILDLLNLFFLVKFTRKPLRLFGSIGATLFASGTLITGYLGAYRLLTLEGLADRPLLILGVLLMVMGVQLFSIGLLGELIIFTHLREAKDYQIKNVVQNSALQ